jgi:hypothetical protein
MRREGNQWLTNRILYHIALSTRRAQDSQLHAAQSSEMLHKTALGRTIHASQMPFLESACSSLYILEYCDRGPRGKFYNLRPGSPARACFLNRPVGNTSAFAKRQEKVDGHNCQDKDIQTFTGAVSLVLFWRGYKPAQKTFAGKRTHSQTMRRNKGRT